MFTVLMYTYMYTYTTYMYLHMYVYTYMCTCVYIHIYIYVRVYVHMCIIFLIYINTYIYIYIHVYIIWIGGGVKWDLKTSAQSLPAIVSPRQRTIGGYISNYKATTAYDIVRKASRQTPAPWGVHVCVYAWGRKRKKERQQKKKRERAKHLGDSRCWPNFGQRLDIARDYIWTSF